MATATPPSCLQPDDPTAPLIAGAHARGMFDAFDMTGRAAILLDGEGRALAVTRAAARALGGTLALTDGRPSSRDRADDESLSAAILESLAGRPRQIEIGRPGAELSLRLMPITSGPHQLLAAILLIESASHRVPSPELSRSRAARRAFATH